MDKREKSRWNREETESGKTTFVYVDKSEKSRWNRLFNLKEVHNMRERIVASLIGASGLLLVLAAIICSAIG